MSCRTARFVRLTRIATPANEAELQEIATSVPAGHLGRALASWMHQTSNDAELVRLHQGAALGDVAHGTGRHGQLQGQACPAGRQHAHQPAQHVRSDGAAFDDGTPLPISVLERIAPQAFTRALIRAADGRPANASPKRRHPGTRQKRVAKERDRACVDCGASTLLQYDHVPDYDVSRRTVVEELQLRCAPCHHHHHANGSAA